MNAKTTAIVAIAIISTFLITAVVMKQSEEKYSFSPDILDVTAPVKSISGMLEKKGDGTLELQYKTKDGQINYKVTTSQQTVIDTMTSIKYDLPELPAEIPSFSPDDIPSQTLAMVETDTDLRMLKSREFKATKIRLSEAVLSIKGTVKNKTNNSLTVQTGTEETDSSLANKTLTFIVNEKTELYNLVSGKASSLKLEDLKVNDMVYVFTTNNIKAQGDKRAARIVKMEQQKEEKSKPIIIRIEPGLDTPPPSGQ